MGNLGTVRVSGGQGLEAGEGIAPILKDVPPVVSEMEDKEEPFSSKPVTKEAPQAANPGPAKKLEENILDESLGKATAASAQESTPPVVELTQDQPSQAASGEAMLDHTTSEAATQNQTTSEAAAGGATLDQTTTEEAVEGAKLIQTPQASSTDNQTPTSPVPGATSQISLSTLIGNLRTLELDDKAQVRPTGTRRYGKRGQESGPRYISCLCVSRRPQSLRPQKRRGYQRQLEVET